MLCRAPPPGAGMDNSGDTVQPYPHQPYPQHPQPDWRIEHRYTVLTSHPQPRAWLEQAAAHGKKGFSLNEYLDMADTIQDLLTGSLAGVEDGLGQLVGRTLAKSLGIQVRRFRAESYPYPVGTVILGAACAMAESGYTLKRILQGPDGCLLEGKLAKSWTNHAGSVVCAVAGTTQHARLHSGIHIPGQLGDLGRCKRILAALHARVTVYATAAHA